MSKEFEPIEIRPNIAPDKSRVGSIFELIARDPRIMSLPTTDEHNPLTIDEEDRSADQEEQSSETISPFIEESESQ